MTESERELSNKIMKALEIVVLGREVGVTAYCMGLAVVTLCRRIDLSPEESVELLRQVATMIESGVSPADFKSTNDN